MREGEGRAWGLAISPPLFIVCEHPLWGGCDQGNGGPWGVYNMSLSGAVCCDRTREDRIKQGALTC